MYSLLDVLSPEGGDTDKETSGTGAEVALAALAGLHLERERYLVGFRNTIS